MNIACKYLFLLFVIVLAACGAPAKKLSPEESPRDSIRHHLEALLMTLPEDAVPLSGHRFRIKGDFDGDGKTEWLTEHFYSRIQNKETDKFYNGLDYDQLVELAMAKDPVSFIASDNALIDTLYIASGQIFGLSYLKNEGDLNGDGTDEISYVVDYADWSNLNICYIMTYRDNRWQELYSFNIRDWQLPSLPQTANSYGPFGLENRIIGIENDSISQQMENEFNHFEGFIKKTGTDKIRIIIVNEEAEIDSVTITF